jgi:hypothetical protein
MAPGPASARPGGTERVSRRAGIGLIVGLVVALLLAFVAWQLVRSPVEARSAVAPAVVIVCTASTDVDADACAAWGDELLDAGPPSTTFELKDLARVELGRTLLGFGRCEAVYFLGRYPDSAVWTEPVACLGGG